MTSLKTSIKTITYLSDTGCLEIQGASLPAHEDGTSPDVIFVVITYIINDARYGEFDDYPLK
nr:hypothetical protein [Shigella flexneri]